MTWQVVAKKDFEDAIRAKTLWVLVALFALMIAAATWYFANVQLGNSGGVPAEQLIGSLFIPTRILLPAIGVLVGYKAIVGERDSGSLKILLSLPHERRDVVFGKFLGRTAVVAAAVAIGFLIGGIVFATFAESLALGKYLQFLAMTVVLGAVFVGISVGFSAATRSGTLAIVVGIGLVLLFTFLWDLLNILLLFSLSEYTEMGMETIQDVVGFVGSINPTTAYTRILQAIFDSGGQFAGIDGFYNEPWFAVVVLAFWLVAPLGLGYWRFENAEL